MKWTAMVLASLVLLAVLLFLVRETADVVSLASTLHPGLGRVVLWLLLLIYACVVGVPALLFLRLREPLRPPPTDAGPDFERHLARLATRLARNPHLKTERVTADRRDVERAIQTLGALADEHITKEASLVFVSTAISQSGRLDALMVLIVQVRMIWNVAHVYWQRPSLREMVYLYANVGATVFAAQTIQDLDLSELLEPIMATALPAAAGGATVVLIPVASLVSDSLLQGSVNALLTFRVGCITKRYCSGLPLPERRAIRRSATSEAAGMLSRVVGDLAKYVSAEIWKVGKRVIKKRTFGRRAPAIEPLEPVDPA